MWRSLCHSSGRLTDEDVGSAASERTLTGSSGVPGYPLINDFNDEIQESATEEKDSRQKLAEYVNVVWEMATKQRVNSENMAWTKLNAAGKQWEYVMNKTVGRVSKQVAVYASHR